MTTSPRLHRRLAACLVALVAAVVVAGCGSSTPSKPAVCSDIDALQKTAQSIKDTSISQGALSQVSSDLQKMKTQLATLKTDAKSQYAAQIDQLSTGLDTLRTTVDAATASPSVTTLAPVVTAVGSVADSAKSLEAAVQKTC